MTSSLVRPVVEDRAGDRPTGRSRAILVLSISVVIGLSVDAFGQALQTDVRVVLYQSGYPIPSRVVDGDSVLIIQRTWDASVAPQTFADVKSDLAFAVDASDMAAIIDVTDVVGELTSDKSWITSKVEGRVVDVLMSKSRRVAAGSTLIVNYDGGGEIVVRRTRVSTAAVLDSIRDVEESRLELMRLAGRLGHPMNVEKGRRYLMFLRSVEADRFRPITLPLAIEGGVILSPNMRPTGEPELLLPLSSLYGMTIPSVIAQVRVQERK